MIPKNKFHIFLETHDGHGRLSSKTRKFLEQYFDHDMVNKIMDELIRLEKLYKNPHTRPEGKMYYFDDTTYEEFFAMVVKINWSEELPEDFFPSTGIYDGKVLE